MLTAAIEATGLIVVAVFVVTAFGVAYGLKTRKGSGINEHPGPDALDHPREPAVEGSGDLPEEGLEEDTVLDQHGTK